MSHRAHPHRPCTHIRHLHVPCHTLVLEHLATQLGGPRNEENGVDQWARWRRVGLLAPDLVWRRELRNGSVEADWTDPLLYA
jgi:hypothetical protein